MLVSEILRIKGKVLYTIGPQEALATAVATMAGQDVGSLVVFDAGRLVGMLTFREVLRAVHANGAAWERLPVNEVMVREPVTVTPEMQIDHLRRLMLERHVRYLPVMDGRMLLGVISFHDVAKAVLEEQSFENRMLKNYISNTPAEAGEAS